MVQNRATLYALYAFETISQEGEQPVLSEA